MNIVAAAPTETRQDGPVDGDGRPRRALGRLASAFLLVASGAAGAAAATAALLLSGVLTGEPRPPTWPVSAALVGMVAALWFAGLMLAVMLAATRRRPTRLQGWLAAFGLAPFAVAAFFFVVGVGVTGGLPGGYVAIAAVLALAVLMRRLLAATPEKLLIAFFVWLCLLVLPVFWSDPVNETFSAFLLWLLRVSGVIV